MIITVIAIMSTMIIKTSFTIIMQLSEKTWWTARFAIRSFCHVGQSTAHLLRRRDGYVEDEEGDEGEEEDVTLEEGEEGDVTFEEGAREGGGVEEEEAGPLALRTGRCRRSGRCAGP